MPARLFWNVLGWIGFLFVVLAALNYDGKTPYPGWRAIPPSLGAALMIAAGGRCNGVFSVTCLLSLKPMQALGRISYGWYLWHWPILTLSGVIYIQAGETTRLALALCALFLAAFSFRFVELPIRRNGALLRYPKRIVLGAICASLLMANFALSWNRRAEKARFDPLWTQIEEARSDLSELYAYGCDTWFFSAELTVCAFGDQRATHTAVLMGDSVGAQWFPALKPRFTQLGWRLLVLTKSSCPMVEKSFFYPRIGKEYTVCTEWRQRALDFLREQKPEQVFLGSAVSSGGFSDAEWTEGSRKVLAALSPYVGAITLIRGTPILPFNAPDCLADETFFTNFLAGENRCSAKPDDTRNEAVFAALRVAARDFPNTRLLDMNDAICPDGLCGAQRENLVVFRDNQHLTARFTAHLAEIFSNRLDALWADAKNQEIAE
ncbi:MAG: acyltransferase [Zoogloeaceae bacterium]|jgi:hypothetical protein|nr:acyltransferase [Zoogloeaceae bacterium]